MQPPQLDLLTLNNRKNGRVRLWKLWERGTEVVEAKLKRNCLIGCRKFLTPLPLVSGNPRLNLAFVANLFNTHPGLEPLDEQEAKDYGQVEDFDAEGEREARVFTLWLNSLGVEPGVFNFFENLKDGLIILQAFDKILPGSVVWRRVSKPKEGAGPASYASGGGGDEGDEGADIDVTPNQSTLSRLKAVEKTNYAVLARQNGMHMVGIQGADIVDGNKTPVPGLVWQLMRMNITKPLSALSKSAGGKMTDMEMLKWANTTAQKGKSGVRSIRSFKDPSITTGLFFLDLLDAIRPGIVDPSLVIAVAETGDYEERRQSAKLAISIARKMNTLVFLVPEDIVDVRPRLILTFVGSLMSIAQSFRLDFVIYVLNNLEGENWNRSRSLKTSYLSTFHVNGSRMSSTIPSKTRKQKHCDWVFNFRTQYASSDDSQSGSESEDQELATAKIGASRLLIDDLDLATREEHVAYKPNPFSIAKINAAYRPTSTVNGSVLLPAQPVRPTDKPTQTRKSTGSSSTNSGQITIMEGFKTQAMKKPRTNALKLPVPLRPTTNPMSLNSNPTVKNPVADKPIAPASSTTSTTNELSSFSVHTAPCSVPTTMIPNASNFPSSSSSFPEYAHILPVKASHHDAQTLSKTSQSRAFAPPAQLLADMLRNQPKCTENRLSGFSSFSSPGHPYDDGPLDYDSRILYTQTYSSPIQLVRKSPFRPYSTITQPFSRQTMETRFVPPFLKPFDPKRVSLQRSSSPVISSYSRYQGSALEPSSPIVKIKDQSDHSLQLKLVGDYVVRANETSSESPRHPPSFASTSKSSYSAKSPNQRQYVKVRPAGLLPSPSLISGTFPNPSNHLARRRIPDDLPSNSTQVKSYPKRDAYQHSTEDPDESWTTLPPRKKRKPKLFSYFCHIPPCIDIVPSITMPRNSTYTKSFHIPGLRLPSTVKAESNTTSAARRVTVYLPPPPNSVDVKSTTTEKSFGSKRTGASMKETGDGRYVAPPSPTNFDADAYPSPSTSSSKPSLPFISEAKRSLNCSSPRSRLDEVRAVAPYRPLSPPTSDLPVPSDAVDIHLEVDHEGIQLRYPEMKRLSRKVSCS
ncbi:hypothetical protein BYT27DRAFT_7253232 [Phlegmacium glaucopus]|nr:hypothetical protein BYT27DRAFT_7253232 [Phlegmacium glaucopus]